MGRRTKKEMKQEWAMIRDVLDEQPELNNTEVARILHSHFPELELEAHRTNVRNFKKRYNTSLVVPDKKVGIVNWRDWTAHAETHQKLHKDASFSQDVSSPEIKTEDRFIIIQPLSDLHLGAIGTDYRLFKDYTNLLLTESQIFVALIGDMTDNFVRFRNVLAMHQQIFNPDQQAEIFRSWIEEVKHKIVFATWGNHEEFEERASGRNAIKDILKHSVPYHNGIAEVRLKVNDIEYDIVATHKTRYNSSFNMTHGLKQLMRKDVAGADVYIAGDKHNPSMEMFFEQQKVALALMMGTLKIDDGYSKRYFASKTSSAFPCVVLDSKEKNFIPFWNIKEALRFITA